LSYILKKKNIYIYIYVCIPCSFLVINVCSQGKNLCSPCILRRNIKNKKIISSDYIRVFCRLSSKYFSTKWRIVIKIVTKCQWLIFWWLKKFLHYVTGDNPISYININCFTKVPHHRKYFVNVPTTSSSDASFGFLQFTKAE